MKLTSSYLNTLTRQDVFDVIAWHLLNQNARALSRNGKCVYRAADGKRCAIGWIMPDDVYMVSLETYGVRDLADMLADSSHGREFSRFLCTHVAMLRDLQGMHDGRQPQEWPVALRVMAQRYHVNAKVIDHFCGVEPRRPPRETAYLLDLASTSKRGASHEVAGADHVVA